MRKTDNGDQSGPNENNRRHNNKPPDKQSEDKNDKKSKQGDGPNEDNSLQSNNFRGNNRRGRGNKRGGRGRGRGNRGRRNNHYSENNEYVAKNSHGNHEQDSENTQNNSYRRGGRGRGRGNNRRGRGRGGRQNNENQSYNDEYSGYEKKNSKNNKSTKYSKKHSKGKDGEKESDRDLVTGVGSYKKRQRNRRKNQNQNQEESEQYNNRNGDNKNQKIPEPQDYGLDPDAKPPKFVWTECIICLVKVTPRQPIWNCVRCKTVCHLKCIKDWIFKSNDMDEKNKRRNIPQGKLFNWSCPHCQFQYAKTMPKYYCYCGKTKDPQKNIYIEPHSCGLPCGKYPHENCKHPHLGPCHSGQCPPCEIILPDQDCFCGREVISRKCQEYKDLSCSKTCSKTKNCGKHPCDRICHIGNCTPCSETTTIECFCGKESSSEFICGGAEDVQGGYTCESKCDKLKNCKNHKCEEICHDGACEPCPLIPVPGEKCFCGNKQILEINGQERGSCEEAIPSCGNICGKKMKCGHVCTLICGDHECDCGERKNLFFVRELALSVKTARNVNVRESAVTPERKKTMEKEIYITFVSKFVIKCFLVENMNGNISNKIKVSNFSSPQRCHLGSCGDCKIMVNDSSSCACGQEKIGPPIRCGQRVTWCSRECGKIHPCGHKCYYKCHHGECKPCAEIVDKPCNCGKTIRKNAICSKDYPCVSLCDKLLSCEHKCNQLCHKGDCNDLVDKKRQNMIDNGHSPLEKGCLQECGHIKQACGHPCNEICSHEGECQDEPCKYQIQVLCDCGNRSAFVDCGCKDTKINKKIECDDKCKNLKRFKSLYAQSSKNKPYYPRDLIKFARWYGPYLKKQEKLLHNFLLGNGKSHRVSILKKNPDKKRSILNLVSKHYNLDVFFFKSNTHFIITCSKNELSRPPQVLLSDYYSKILSQEIKVDDLPFEANIKFFNLTIHDSTRDLDIILGDLKDHCYSEKSGISTVYLNLWSKDYVNAVIKKLDKSMSNFSNYSVEIKEEEEEVSNTTEKDVIITEDVVEESTSTIEDKQINEENQSKEGEIEENEGEEIEVKSTDNTQELTENTPESVELINDSNNQEDLVSPNPTGIAPKPINLVEQSNNYQRYGEDYQSSEEEPEITAQDIMKEMMDLGGSEEESNESQEEEEVEESVEENILEDEGSNIETAETIQEDNQEVTGEE